MRRVVQILVVLSFFGILATLQTCTLTGEDDKGVWAIVLFGIAAYLSVKMEEKY